MGSVAATPAQSPLREVSERETRRALDKYPSPLLSQLDRVILVGRLELAGIRAGGTFYERTVIIAADSADSEAVFHHEFASVLRKYCPKGFDEKKWRAANPADFTYVGTGLEAIRRGLASAPRSPAWYMRGFIDGYSTATLDDDFSNVASALFKGDEALWNRAYPALAEKRRLAVAFYEQLDASLSTEYFYRLHQEGMARLGLDAHPMR